MNRQIDDFSVNFISNDIKLRPKIVFKSQCLCIQNMKFSTMDKNINGSPKLQNTFDALSK